MAFWCYINNTVPLVRWIFVWTIFCIFLSTYHGRFSSLPRITYLHCYGQHINFSFHNRSNSCSPACRASASWFEMSLGRTAFAQLGRRGWKFLQPRRFRTSPMSASAPPDTHLAKRLKTTETGKVTRPSLYSVVTRLTYFACPSGHWYAQWHLSLR